MNALLAAIAANWLEIVAVAFGLVSVWLSTREHIVSWPTAIVNVGVFFFLFWKAKLYADAVLQIFYLSTSVYGWWAWLHGGARHDRLQVSRTSKRAWMIGVPGTIVFGAALGAVLQRATDSPVPYLDAMLTAFSLLAQWMMTRKLLENWAVWIVLNIVYVPVLVWRGLPLTAVQYTVFLVLAFMGHVAWKKSLVAEGASPGGDARATAPA
jgi:nicotinamide mononucleotide transporter